MQHALNNRPVYRAAQATAHAARVFSSAVFLALLLVHVNEGARVAPLALASVGFIVAPALLETISVRR